MYLLFQVAELRSYLKSKGAEISEENSADGLITDLAKVIEASEIIFKENVPEAGNANIKLFRRIRWIMFILGVLAVS